MAETIKPGVIQYEPWDLGQKIRVDTRVGNSIGQATAFNGARWGWIAEGKVRSVSRLAEIYLARQPGSYIRVTAVEKGMQDSLLLISPPEVRVIINMESESADSGKMAGLLGNPVLVLEENDLERFFELNGG